MLASIGLHLRAYHHGERKRTKLIASRPEPTTPHLVTKSGKVGYRCITPSNERESSPNSVGGTQAILQRNIRESLAPSAKWKLATANDASLECFRELW